MKNADFASIPTFDNLPVSNEVPPESSWGLFGTDDELGCLNFLTAEGIVEAARLVQSGKVFRLDAKVGFAKPPLFGRASVEHKILKLGKIAHDDLLNNYNTQEGSQWDGLGHVGHATYERFYNGVEASAIQDGPGGRLSIHRWADKFVGRGLLVDVYGWRKSQGKAVNPFETDSYTLDELKTALAAQGSVLKPGTILLVRTGWMEEYEILEPEAKAAMSSYEKMKCIGVERSRDLVAWLWDNRVAAIGTDCPAVEPMPFNFGDQSPLHFRLLALLGMPLGELFILAPLARDCSVDRRYEFMVVSAPMHVEGGIASPPNAVVIK